MEYSLLGQRHGGRIMEWPGKVGSTREPGVTAHHEYSRRELLRNGLVLGGGAAAFAITLSSTEARAAASGTPGGPSVTLAPAQTWPWGAPVDPTMPFYLSPNPGIQGGSSSATGGGGLSSAGPGGRTGIAAPLLVIPVTLTVDIGAPPALTPPFTVQLVATGNALAANTVTSNISFQRSDHATGHTFVKQWLVIVPVVLQSGSLQLQATLPGAVAESSITITGDFGQAPLTSTLLPAKQETLVASIDAQTSTSGFSVQNLFKFISDATASAQAKLLTIQSRSSAISIGDMFEMQMLMNNLSQLSESSTAVISAVNQAIVSMARNVKG